MTLVKKELAIEFKDNNFSNFIEKNEVFIVLHNNT